MILIDTSFWLAFFRGEEPGRMVKRWILSGEALVHPLVVGELLLGGLSTPNEEMMHSLAWCEADSPADTSLFIKEKELSGKSIGWVDAALLASAVRLEARIVTRDRGLERCAADLSLSWPTDGR